MSMKPVARVGDAHACGNPKHGTNAIASGGQAIIEGKPVARLGDSCSCGATIVQGSSQATDMGQPIAYIGCKTQCGPYSGTITSGASQTEVLP